MRRGRRVVVRALACISCVAVAAAVLVSTPTEPARAVTAATASRAAMATTASRAATAAAAVSTAAADGPITVTYPGGDLVASFDDGGVNPTVMSQELNVDLPQSLGAPAGASLSDLLQLTYAKTANLPADPATSPPPTFAGGSLAVSGSIVTLTIPAASLAAINASNATEPLNGPITGYGGLCMTVLSTADNTPVTFQACDGTQSQHLWLMPDGTIQIYNKCLTANGTGNNSPVVLLGCDSDTDQQWTQGGSLSGTLTNTASGRCLDDPGSSTVNGTALIIFDCKGGANQKWTWSPGYVSGPTARVIAAVVGWVSGSVAYSVCLAFFAVPTGGFAVTFCSFWYTFAWTLLFGLVTDVLIGTPLNSATWKNLLTGALVAGVGGAVGGFYVKALGQTLPAMLRFLVIRIAKFLGRSAKWLGNWIGSKVKQFSNYIMSFIRRTAADAPIELQPIDAEAGLPTPQSTGEVTAGIASKCADATGATSTDLGPDGAPVILNDCAGQAWQTWPDGELTISGSCLTVHGDSTAGGALAELDDCAGKASQVWEQSGGALKNPVSGLCLDDPNASTVDGTQLRIWPCNGSPAQQWAPASSPVTYPACNLYANYGTACVTAYSMVRELYAGYDGPLYQVKRASDGTTADIGLLPWGGYVDATEQDSFCANTACTITMIYDQSPDGNDLTVAPAGGGAAPAADNAASATALPITAGGHKAYGLDIEEGVGYRDNSPLGTAVGGAPEGMYMVASGTHVNSGCCFDFGNAETDSQDHGAGTMDAVNLSTTCWNGGPCTGSGPWVQADLENGLFMGANNTELANQGNSSDFVTAMLKNDGQTTFALKGGNSQSGGLSTWWDGALPSGYTMNQQGAIILGTGGDNSNSDIGSFFEGVMTEGYPTDDADNAVQANIVAAGYAGNSSSGGNPTGGSELPASAAGPAVVHDGYSSVYTVDSANGHLQESYLPAMGDPWYTQDLSAEYQHTPPVMPGTKPVALTHNGYTSVYTIDASNGDLQETFLPVMGGPWSTQDLSAQAHTPASKVTPTAVYHSGYTSVYTVDGSTGDLWETYLPAIGDLWTSQDLSTEYQHTPTVAPGTSPVAILHSGYTSVFTVDANNDLQETYLPAMGDPWSTQDLSAEYQHTPRTAVTPTAVVHDGYTSVYTVDLSDNHLQETYLPAMGDPWYTQDLSAEYQKTPPVAPGTAPVALVHTGYTSVYTVDQGSDDVQETFLPAMGDPWSTQDLTAKYHTPTTVETPIVLLHPDTSGALTWTSVYTISEFSDHLWEAYLPAIGDSWSTQDLSAEYQHTPPVAVSGSSAAGWSVAHAGYTSVYTAEKDGDLQETYLTAMGKPWATQDLSTEYQDTPKVLAGTAPVTVTHDGYTSVYTIDASNGDLQETFLPAIGGPWYTQDLSAQAHTPASKVTPTAVYHSGYTSVYTVDRSTGDLWETYLPAIGDQWTSQDLTANYKTPQVDAYTSPTAVYHDGFTSVYTVDAATSNSALGDLQETYLPAIGDQWVTQNLSVKYTTPLVNTLTSPTAVVHNGYVSVYTADSASSTDPYLAGDLQETFLPALGESWQTQDLSVNYHTPRVEAGMQPVALYHTGYTSVYTVDAGENYAGVLTSNLGHVQETYLPAISGPWTTQDLTAQGAPTTTQAPTALLHYDTSGGLTWTSLYIANVTGDLWETFLPAMGDSWTSQDLTVNGTPSVSVQQPVTGSR
jgi:hypothetical protein